jgi:hypothetical protein
LLSFDESFVGPAAVPFWPPQLSRFSWAANLTHLCNY